MNEYFNPSFVGIIPPTKHIINTHNGFKICKEFFSRHKICQLFGNKRRPSLTTADVNLITCLSFIVLDNNNTDIMKLNRGTVVFMTCYGNFKLSREVRKFGVKS